LPSDEPAFPLFSVRVNTLTAAARSPPSSKTPAQIGIRKLFAVIRKQAREPQYAKAAQPKD